MYLAHLHIMLYLILDWYKADTLNADLMKTGAYSKIDLKNVTAWLGLRNDAAHGNYSAYDDKQVSLLISSIRDFVARNPA